MFKDPWHYIAEISQKELLTLLSKWKEDYPGCSVLATVSEKDIGSVQMIQRSCKELEIGVIGAVFPRLIVSSQVQEKGILLIRMDTMPKYVLSDNLAENGTLEHVADNLLLSISSEEKQTLLMLFDAMTPNISSLLDRSYLKVSDKVSYIGASAGSESFQTTPCLFDSSRFESGGVLAVLWPEKEASFIGHGYLAPDRHITATSSSKNCIHSIEWRPAFDVYQEFAFSEYGVTITKENFYSVAVKFPFGIIRGCGDVLVRIPVAIGDNGSLFCTGEIPENAMLTLLQSSEEDLMKGAIEFEQGLPASEFSPGLIFYCAGRAMFLGEERVQAELNALSRRRGPVIGMMTLGEIGSTADGSYPVLHNAAIAYCPHPAR